MKRILLPAGGAILATGLLAAGLAGSAQAAGDVATDPMAASAAKAAQVVNFWLASDSAALKQASAFHWDAKAVDKLVSKGGYQADSKPTLVSPIGADVKPAAKVHNVNLPRTIGKVFFVDSKGEFKWCSATSIMGAYNNLVATAGHCVYDIEGNGDTLDNWVFVPGYYQGKTPYGIYAGKQAFTHYDFDVYEDFDRDYAFVTVYNAIKPGTPTVTKVSKAAFDAHVGYKDAKDVAITAAEYQKCVDLNGGETADCWAKASTIEDLVGPDYPGAVKVLKEVSLEAYTAAPVGKVNGGKAPSKTVTEFVTESEYKGYTGPGYRKIDDKGNFTITHYFVKYFVKKTDKVEYFRTDFFIITNLLKDGGRLGDNVGGQGVAFNQPTGKYVRTFGYPASAHPDGSRPYTGVTPKWCYGKTSAKVVGSSAKKIEEHVALKCAVTNGYDGGPWLLKYSNAKRLGYVNGVTSTIVDQDGNSRYDWISSPYFDSEASAVYAAAAKTWSGKLVG